MTKKNKIQQVEITDNAKNVHTTYFIFYAELVAYLIGYKSYFTIILLFSGGKSTQVSIQGIGRLQWVEADCVEWREEISEMSCMAGCLKPTFNRAYMGSLGSSLQRWMKRL